MEVAEQKIIESMKPENAIKEWASSFSRVHRSVRKAIGKYIVTNWVITPLTFTTDEHFSKYATSHQSAVSRVHTFKEDLRKALSDEHNADDWVLLFQQLQPDPKSEM
jgi:hypothetical protein